MKNRGHSAVFVYLRNRTYSALFFIYNWCAHFGQFYRLDVSKDSDHIFLYIRTRTNRFCYYWSIFIILMIQHKISTMIHLGYITLKFFACTCFNFYIIVFVQSADKFCIRNHEFCIVPGHDI